MPPISPRQAVFPEQVVFPKQTLFPEQSARSESRPGPLIEHATDGHSRTPLHSRLDNAASAKPLTPKPLDLFITGAIDQLLIADGWIGDDKITKLSDILPKPKCVLVIDACVVVPQKKPHFHRLLSKVIYQNILVPVNGNRNHWVRAYISKPTHTITYYDSLSWPLQPHQKLIEHCILLPNEDWVPGPWEHNSAPSQ